MRHACVQTPQCQFSVSHGCWFMQPRVCRPHSLRRALQRNNDRGYFRPCRLCLQRSRAVSSSDQTPSDSGGLSARTGGGNSIGSHGGSDGPGDRDEEPEWHDDEEGRWDRFASAALLAGIGAFIVLAIQLSKNAKRSSAARSKAEPAEDSDWQRQTATESNIQTEPREKPTKLR